MVEFSTGVDLIAAFASNHDLCVVDGGVSYRGWSDCCIRF